MNYNLDWYLMLYSHLIPGVDSFWNVPEPWETSLTTPAVCIKGTIGNIIVKIIFSFHFFSTQDSIVPRIRTSESTTVPILLWASLQMPKNIFLKRSMSCEIFVLTNSWISSVQKTFSSTRASGLHWNKVTQLLTQKKRQLLSLTTGKEGLSSARS